MFEDYLFCVRDIEAKNGKVDDEIVFFCDIDYAFYHVASCVCAKECPEGLGFSKGINYIVESLCGMRAKITVRKISRVPIHFDYQYGIASMLYARLAAANVRLANEIHSHQGFKFYTFSNLVIEDWIPAKGGLDFTKAHFFISSPDTEFIRSFTEGLLLEPEFFLGAGEKEMKVDFIIERVEILPPPVFSDSVVFRTLSPVYVKTQRKKDGRLVEVDLYPKDSKFYENLHTNLVERYEEFYGHGVEHDHFEVLDVSDVKPKRVSIGNSFRRCSLMKMTVEASPELIGFAYDAGVGEKNAMGFGCVDVVK